MRAKKFIASIAAATLLSQTVSCGYLLYPERQNQGDTGKLDPVVVALDAIGLLFWLVPGLVAFVIDYNNDTIYLPNGIVSNQGDGSTIHLAKEEMTKEGIEKAIATHTGKTIDLDDTRAQKQVIKTEQIDNYLSVSL